jgi:hypothetical protein
MGGFEGPSLQDIGHPTGFTAPQGAQAVAFTVDTTIVDLLP